MKLKEKVILITGGGRGIGKAIAMHYGREGAALALCARSAAELEQTVKELRAMNVDAGLELRCLARRTGTGIHRQRAQEIWPHRCAGQQRRGHDPACADD